MSRLANLLQRLRGQANEPMRDDVAGAGPVADVRFQIPNMVCEGCAEKLDGALRSLAGVREIRSSVAQKRILIRYEPTRIGPEQLKDAVNRAGFTAVEA